MTDRASRRTSPPRPPSVALIAAVLAVLAVACGLAAPALAAPDDPDTPADPGAPEPTTPPTEPAPTSDPAEPEPAPPTTGPPAPTSTVADPAPAPLGQITDGSQLAQILATIRYMESRGIYTLPPNRGNASGAYQFIQSTWAGYGGYEHAYLAPPEVQDQRAAEDVTRFLGRWGNDVSMIPVMWYYPLAASNPDLMDIVPVPEAGNVLTIREYQARWLAVFATISGRPVPPVRALGTTASVGTAGAFGAVPTSGGPPVVPQRQDNRPSVAFPVMGPARLAIPDCDEALDGGAPVSRSSIGGSGLCSASAPAIVFGTQLQPVLAVADGVVTGVTSVPGSDIPIEVTVTDVRGRSYVYRGFNDDSPGTDDGLAPPHLRLSALARSGATVRAGQVLGFMGNSSPLPPGVDGEEGRPHVHLEIFDLDGRPLDAYGPVIDALFLQTCTLGTGPWSMPPNGDGHAPLTIAAPAVDEPDDAGSATSGIVSEWRYTSTGQVTASGSAAMINPQPSCDFVPDEHHGPGAAGSVAAPAEWATPLRLPTTMWVELAAQADGVQPDLFIRRL